MVWYGMVWYGMVWYGMVWYGMVWYGMVDHLKILLNPFEAGCHGKFFRYFVPLYVSLCLYVIEHALYFKNQD